MSQEDLSPYLPNAGKVASDYSEPKSCLGPSLPCLHFVGSLDSSRDLGTSMETFPGSRAKARGKRMPSCLMMTVHGVSISGRHTSGCKS